jgi:signal transduction histidine kinase
MEGATRLAGHSLTSGESSTTSLLGLSLVENPDLEPLLAIIKNDQAGAVQIHLGDQAMLVSHAPLQETGWTLSIAVPLSELSSESDTVSTSIYNDGRATVQNTLLAMAGLYLMVIFISVWLSYRYLNRPLRQLLRGVRAVTAGDLNVTVPVISQDELGELAESFNQMTGELNSRTQQLSQTSNELEIKETQLKVVALEERQRLARELHDSVSQALYGIALGARTARTQLERDPAKAAEPLDYVLSLAEAGLAEMRALIFELRPESLQNEGLVAALTKQTDAVRTRHKLDVVTSFCLEPDISLDTKETLYRITQESIYNVIRHASASRIELSLKVESGLLILEVKDNGKGFDPQGFFPGHLGLQSMRERVDNINGTFQIKSKPNQGTVVRVELAL